MMPTLSSMIARRVVLTPTYSAPSDNRVIIVTTLSFHWSQCNSYEERVPLNFIDGYPFFKWVAVARSSNELHWTKSMYGYLSSSLNNGRQGKYPIIWDLTTNVPRGFIKVFVDYECTLSINRSGVSYAPFSGVSIRCLQSHFLLLCMLLVFLTQCILKQMVQSIV